MARMNLLRMAMIGTVVALAARSSLAAEQQPNGNSAGNAAVAMLDFGQPCHRMLPEDTSSKTTGAVKPPNTRGKFSEIDYPPFARRMNQEGTVMLQMLITDEGKVGQVRLQASSGWPRLDDAAMNASRDWEFIPGQWEGKATCMWVSMPIVYKLSDYTDAALSAVTVSPESQSISQFILGDKVLQEMVSQSSVKQKESSTEEQVAGQLAAVLSTRQEWHKALHDVAAMLTIELSAAEIEELNTLMKTPVLQKYYGLQNKLQPEIVRRQQYFGAVAYCVTGIMRQAAGVSDLEELSSNTLPAAMVPATPRIAKELEPYCDCMAERLTTTRNPNLARQICGAPPKITW